MPQAEQIGILFFIAFAIRSKRFTSLKDLIKDTPEVKESRKKIEEDKKAQHPEGFEPMTS